MTIRHQFITHIESDAQTALEGCFQYACKGTVASEFNDETLNFDFELRVDKNVVTFKAKFDSSVEKLELDENLGFFFNYENNGLTAWRCLINRLWSKLRHNYALYDEFMSAYFGCDCNDLYEGCF